MGSEEEEKKSHGKEQNPYLNLGLFLEALVLHLST